MSDSQFGTLKPFKSSKYLYLKIDFFRKKVLCEKDLRKNDAEIMEVIVRTKHFSS